MPETTAKAVPFIAARVLAATAAVGLATLAVLQLQRVAGSADSFVWIRISLLGLLTTGALLSGWFALRGHRPASRERLWRLLQGGIVVGSIGFALGFLGPILLSPESPQGPFLGIFMTGPLGFAAGILIAALLEPFRRA